MSDNLLEKVISTTSLGVGTGLLNPEQSSRFIDYMWDATALGKDARTVRLRAEVADIDKVNVGSRLTRVATEATDDHVNADATFSKISLTTTKLRLDWELSSEALEDGIEGNDLEDHVARLMATQMGNDIEDVAINGDTTLTGDPLLKAFDGWRKKGLAGGRVVDAAGSGLNKAVFNSAIKAMPRKYKQRRNQLKFYTGSNLVQDYLYTVSSYGAADELAQAIITGKTAGPEGSGGGVYPYAFGIPVFEVPLFDETLSGTYSGASGQHGEVVLTFPQNRLWGVKREIQVFREFKPKKDTIEYTVFTRVGAQIENLDAWVVVKNVKVAA